MSPLRDAFNKGSQDAKQRHDFAFHFSFNLQKFRWQHLILFGGVMKNRVRKFSQPMQRSLVRIRRKNVSDAIDSLGQVIALSIVVVAEHCLRPTSLHRACYRSPALRREPSRADKIGLRDPIEGEKAAETIGRALARQKCRLVAYSAAELSVEHLVVRGYVAECNSNSTLKEFRGEPGRIEVPYSANEPRPEFPELESNPEPFFRFQPDRNPSWASSFYRSLSAVDGVILIGGSDTTYVAGTVAISHRKPVAPLFAFGGTSEHLWKELSPEPGLLEQDEINLLTRRPDANTADTLVRNLLKQKKQLAERARESEVARQRTLATRHVYISVPFLIAALATVPFTWDNPELQRTNLLFILLFSPLLAGISGATARTAFEAVAGNGSEDKPNIVRTCGLGAIAGAVAGALFIIAQLVAMSPEIGQAIWSKQAGRLVPFAVLIGFVAGLTLDAVFRRLTGVNVITDEMLKTLTERVSTQPGRNRR